LASGRDAGFSNQANGSEPLNRNPRIGRWSGAVHNHSGIRLKEYPEKAFTDKVALVTGATSGIGGAAALAFAREGARVVVSGRRKEEGHETVALIQQIGGKATFVQTDVTREPEVAALVGATLAAYGRLDVAFNNAGVEGTPGSIHEQTVENHQHIMDANVLGLLLSLKHEFAAMVKGGGGAIVNNASVAELVGFPGAALYVASKHAVMGLTKPAALEYATRGIQVNAVAPGAVETPMFDRFTAAWEPIATARLPRCTLWAARARPEKSPQPSCGCVRTRRPSSRANPSPWMEDGRPSSRVNLPAGWVTA
jgi:NAD(P)-dependent dehydrogenase (short-subunit alcohol dehydrogenase family)